MPLPTLDTQMSFQNTHLSTQRKGNPVPIDNEASCGTIFFTNTGLCPSLAMASVMQQILPPKPTDGGGAQPSMQEQEQKGPVAGTLLAVPL